MSKTEIYGKTEIHGENVGITDKNIAELEGVNSKPMSNSLSKQRVKKMFRMFCFHSIVATPDMIQDCSGCILREIPWRYELGVKSRTENLCYAIWHEGILNG